MSRLSSMKDIFDVWNENIIEPYSKTELNEHRGKSLCDGNSKERRVCKDRDEASRKRSTKKRKLKRETLPAKEALDQLSKGITEEELVHTEKKKKKPNCGVGNPRHDKLGRFSSKADNTSWGLGHYGRTDGKCQSGKSRMSQGSNRRYIQKARCGAKETGPKGGVGKHKYRCKDGSAVWQEVEGNDEWVKVKKSAFQKLIGTDIDLNKSDCNDMILFEKYIEEAQSTDDKIKRFCNQKSYYSFRDYLLKVNLIKRANDGDLFDKPKNSK